MTHHTLAKNTIRSSLYMIIIGIIMLFLTYVGVYNVFVDMLLNWFGYILMVWIICTWKKETKEKIFCPYIVFSMFFVLFNYGQPLLWALGIHVKNDLSEGLLFLGSNYTITNEGLQLLKAWICIAIIAVHLGALVGISNRAFRVKKNKKESALADYHGAMFFTGCVFGVVSIPLTIYRYSVFYTIANTLGYGAIYYNNNFPLASLTFITEMFFFPALLCILIGGKYKKKYQIFVWGVFLIYLVINLMMGDRGTWLYKLIVLIWLEMEHYQIRIKPSMFFVIGAISLVLLTFVYAVVDLRDAGNITLSDALNNIENIEFPLVKGMAELGGSMNIMGFLITQGTDFWQAGNSYITSILGVVTSRFFGILGLEVTLIDDYFSDFIAVNYGTGFSLLGEAYLNCKELFPVIVFIFGFLFAKIFVLKRDNELRVFEVASALAILVGWIRGSSYLYFKSFFYGVIVFVIIIKLLSRVKFDRFKK